MSAKKIPIGIVAVTDSDTTNPYRYRGPLYSGVPRLQALTAFYRSEDTTGMSLWYAPPSGGARRITADDVDWSTSSISLTESRS